jgi:hypothetical protein
MAGLKFEKEIIALVVVDILVDNSGPAQQIPAYWVES